MQYIHWDSIVTRTSSPAARPWRQQTDQSTSAFTDAGSKEQGMAIRFTTPALTLIVRGIDLTGMDAVTVSLRQRIGKAESTHEVDVTDPTMTYDGTDTTITVPLTQEQAGGFVAGAYVLAQVNWMEGDAREASTIGRVAWGENLLDEVMTNE